MSDPDDALRKDLGWTGPEETNYEPAPVEPTFTPAATPLPSRPPVDFIPFDATPPENPAPEPPAPEPPASYPPREPERTSGGAHQTPPRYGPPPGTPRDTGPLNAPNRPDMSQPGCWVHCWVMSGRFGTFSGPVSRGVPGGGP